MFYKTSEPHGLPHDPFKSCIVPRPIAWVTSIHPNGAINLAPFSFFNALASDPPMVMIAFTGYHQHGGEKDTLHNIKTSGEFVVNMVPLAIKDAMNVTSGPHEHDVNELELAGLTADFGYALRCESRACQRSPGSRIEGPPRPAGAAAPRGRPGRRRGRSPGSSQRRSRLRR